MPSTFQKTTLKNGVRVLTESYPQSHAVTLGIWILTGTRDEPEGLGGISHLLEHMVFKGTKRRSTKEIAMSLESVGGELNAFTTKEYTCYHTLSLREHLELSIDVLADLVTSATFPAKEFEREKKVVLQEIAMSYEEYDEYIYDFYLHHALGDHPTGRPILGTGKTVRAIRREDIRDYYRSHHHGGNVIVTGAGALEHQRLVELVEKALSGLKPGRRRRRRPPRKIRPVRDLIQKPSEQVHVLVGMAAPGNKSRFFYESYFVNTLLGGGMTSRLYQSIREKKGLAYSVYGYPFTFVDFAINFYYAGTDRAHCQKTVQSIFAELHKLKERGISRKDLKLYKTQIKGGLLLAADDLESRMTSMAHNEMIYKKYRPLEEAVAAIERLSVDSVNEYLHKEFHLEEVGLAILGQLPGENLRWVEEIG